MADSPGTSARAHVDLAEYWIGLAWEAGEQGLSSGVSYYLELAESALIDGATALDESGHEIDLASHDPMILPSQDPKLAWAIERLANLRTMLSQAAADDVFADTVSGGPGMNTSLTSSTPTCGQSLWRTENNFILLRFDGPPPVLNPGSIRIQALLPNGGFGPDLSSQFTMTPAGNEVRLDENGPVLAHRTWYAIREVGDDWPGVQDFRVNLL
jgi:hypothetical protein